MSVCNTVCFKTNNSFVENSKVTQLDSTTRKIEEKTKPIFRTLAFLAGLALPAAAYVFTSFAIAGGSPLILLIPLVISLSLLCIPLMGIALTGCPDYPTPAISAEGDYRNDMIDMRPGYLYR